METEKFSPGRGKKNYTRDFLGQKTLQTRSFLFHSFPLFNQARTDIEQLYLDTRKSQMIKTAEPIYWLFSAVILL